MRAHLENLSVPVLPGILLVVMLLPISAHEPVSVVFTISFKSRAAVSSDIKSAIKDSTNKNIPSIEVCSCSSWRLLYLLVVHTAYPIDTDTDTDTTTLLPLLLSTCSDNWPPHKCSWRTSATRSTTPRSRRTHSRRLQVRGRGRGRRGEWSHDETRGGIVTVAPCVLGWWRSASGGECQCVCVHQA